MQRRQHCKRAHEYWITTVFGSIDGHSGCHVVIVQQSTVKREKNHTSLFCLRQRLQRCLQRCLQRGAVTSWGQGRLTHAEALADCQYLALIFEEKVAISLHCTALYIIVLLIETSADKWSRSMLAFQEDKLMMKFMLQLQGRICDYKCLLSRCIQKLQKLQKLQLPHRCHRIRFY